MEPQAIVNDQAGECEYVVQYLDRFTSDRSGLDVDRISEHVNTCSACYDKMAEFFRVLEVPESGYLQESLDDLTLAIYNLVKALLKEPRGDESDHENVRFSQEVDSPATYIEEGEETIDDVQDFTGADDVRGESMEGLREMIHDSSGQFGLAKSLLQRAIDLAGRHSLDCRNLKGILHLNDEELDAAAEMFRGVIRAPAPDEFVRSVQAHSMNNLGYVFQLQGDLDDAIKWSGRSKAVCEEIGTDCFNARFALMYFHLARGADGDVASAAAEVESLLTLPDSRAELERCLAMESNTEIRELYERYLKPAGSEDSGPL